MDTDGLEFSGMLRDGVLEVIASFDIEGIPVGGVLAKIIGLFWTGPDQSQAIWNGLKKYAEELVKEEIDKERIRTLNDRLEGFRDISIEYSQTDFSSPQKGQHLTSLLDELRLFHKSFWDERNPEKMFPLYTTFGTLWLGALWDQAFKYKDIFHTDDPDAARHLKDFRDNVKTYSTAAQAMYDKLYVWRFSKLQLTEWQSSDPKVVGTEYTSKWTFTDKYDGYTRSQSAAAFDSSFHNPHGQALMEREQRDRIFNIQNDYVQGLQETLAVAELWKYLEKDGPRPEKHQVIGGEGPWGGDRDKAQDFADPVSLGSRITTVRLRTEAFIEGVELSYDGRSGGWHGNNVRGKPAELVLAADEYVTEVSGNSTSLIGHLAFKTNKGHTIEGGTAGGAAFTAKGRKAWKDTSLAAISGWTDGNRLTGLKLHWKYMSEHPVFAPSYKSTGNLPLSQNVYLKANDGKMISKLAVVYSRSAAANEYWPKMGDSGVALQFRSPANKTELSDHDAVQIWTTESEAGDYKLLSRFGDVEVYYYTPGYDNKQLWSVIKMIPSDGPVLMGDKVYLRNVAACNYLAPREDGYVVSVSEPYAWEVVVPRPA